MLLLSLSKKRSHLVSMKIELWKMCQCRSGSLWFLQWYVSCKIYPLILILSWIYFFCSYLMNVVSPILLLFAITFSERVTLNTHFIFFGLIFSCSGRLSLSCVYRLIRCAKRLFRKVLILFKFWNLLTFLFRNQMLFLWKLL